MGFSDFLTEIFVTVLGGTLLFYVKSINKQIKQESRRKQKQDEQLKKERKNTNNALALLIFLEIRKNYEMAKLKNTITEEKYREVCKLHTCYKNLDGNGIGDDMVNVLRDIFNKQNIKSERE